MFEVTNANILAAAKSLKSLVNKEMPFTIALKIARLGIECEKALEAFQMEYKNISAKYAKLNDKQEITFMENGHIAIDPDKINDFTEECKTLLNKSIVFINDKLNLNEFATLNLEPIMLIKLQPFFN